MLNNVNNHACNLYYFKLKNESENVSKSFTLMNWEKVFFFNTALKYRFKDPIIINLEQFY